MSAYAIAYDLGTGGLKASIVDENAKTLFAEFVAYDTFYPQADFLEQRPEDWWNSIVSATKTLLKKSAFDTSKIVGIGISGHSLGAVPIDEKGKLLCAQVPIWSDMRALAESQEFFEKFSHQDWYMKTGCGFPAPCYTIFKLMWLKKNLGDVYKKCFKILGTKDFCNFKLTGKLFSDFSYASGWGVFDIHSWKYCEDFISAANLRRDIFPELVDSSEVIGTLTREAATELGLPEGVKVVCGGVDNSCMALGASCIGSECEAQTYMSLGSSAWIANVANKPVLDFKYKPYVFCHVNKAYYTSATCIFSAGTSLRWVRDTICADLVEVEKNGGANAYAQMDKLAAKSEVGAGGVVFNPSLAGGSAIEDSAEIRGAFAGISLSTSREDLVRATLEGIALNLKHALNILSECSGRPSCVPVVGGGGKSEFWLEIFADVFNCEVVKSSVDQDAATIGAAALAFKGCGVWADFSQIVNAREVEFAKLPDPARAEVYAKLFARFMEVSKLLASLRK